MTIKRSYTFALIVAATVLLAAATLSLVAARGQGKMRAAQREPISLESAYAGQVRLKWAVAGVYSDTLTAPDGVLPDLGSIDLGFLLHCNQNTLSGYVDLDATLVFTGEHTITTTQSITTPLRVGPAVHGACGSANVIESERFVFVTEAGQRVMRQFRLSGALADPTTFKGEYRETLWGYGAQPLTIVGDYTLQLMSGDNIAFARRVYLPLVLRQS